MDFITGAMKRGTRLSFKRFVVVFIVFPGILIWQGCNRLFLFLDLIFFPGFKKIEVGSALFITGLPRSGTTYLFRLLALDTSNFTSFKLWEILFTPSICQKLMWLPIQKLNRVLGGPLVYLVRAFDRLVLGDFRKIHEMGLLQVEEDDLLLLPFGQSSYYFFLFQENRNMRKLLNFDFDLELNERKKIMSNYKGLVQRHLYMSANRDKKFLSKNPSFVSRITSLKATFPEAEVLYLFRDPKKVIPSFLSLTDRLFKITGSIKLLKSGDPWYMNQLLRWYEDSLDLALKNGSIILSFPDVVGDTSSVIRNLYNELKLEMRHYHVQQTLINSYSNYKSSHNYEAYEALLGQQELSAVKAIKLKRKGIDSTLFTNQIGV
ncbi:sulfotransferase [bacterium]|nr:sulfotransferase [bacterium]